MREKTLEFSLAAALPQKHVIALGWLLANGSTREMQEALCAPGHVAEVRRVQAALSAQAPWACEAGSEAKGKAVEGVRAVKR